MLRCSRQARGELPPPPPLQPATSSCEIKPQAIKPPPAALALPVLLQNLSPLNPQPHIPYTSTRDSNRPNSHSPPPLQCHKHYIYATAQAHDVDGWNVIEDGDTFVRIDAGFEIAPGDANDVEVANAHAWGSWCLVFSDGTLAATALNIAENPSRKGIACSYPL